MNLYEAGWYVGEMLENTQVVYLRTEPEVPDFTCHEQVKVIIAGGKRRVEILLDRHNAAEVAGFLHGSVFDHSRVTTLLTWNIKSLVSFFQFYVPKSLLPRTSVIDLSVIERFLGIHREHPENLLEAVNRSRVISASKAWKTLYKALHLPLMLQVLPALETTPLLDEVDRCTKYAYYEIEGQTNARLRCAKYFKKGYLPHTLGDKERTSLKPRGYGRFFLCFDFRHCEVAVLQWLSKDPQIQEIIESGKEVYAEIYRRVTGDQCDTDKKRDLTKLMFLPVMYGCGGGTLAKNLLLSEEVGRELVSRVHAEFPVATSYMASAQEEAKNKQKIEDYFGRPRVFEEPYLARNFRVQSVAATFCLEKLNQVYKSLEKDAQLVFSIHDGYGLTCTRNNLLATWESARDVLEKESDLCPGLSLRVQTKFGPRLNKLRVFK